MAKSVWFQHDTLPESVNKLYFNKGGRRVLSSAGRKFKQAFVAARGGSGDLEFMNLEVEPNAAYELHLWFYVSYERLYNVTFGSDGRVKSPYSDMDTSNMVKLIEDAIAELVGIRDRNNFTVMAHKREAFDGPERVVAFLRPLDLENDPYDESNFR